MGVVVKQVLNMRCGKVHIFHFLKSLLIPVLSCNIGIFLLQCNRLCGNQAAIMVIDSDAAQIPAVCLI